MTNWANGLKLQSYKRLNPQVDGLVLADANIDAWTLEPFEGKPVVAPPKDFVLLCAESDFFDNGGVGAGATFKYDSLGKDLRCPNGGDEVILRTKADTTIDRVNYGSSFSEEGSSLGVDPDHATASGNNSLSNWCSQWASLAFGDSGSRREKR